MIEKPKPDELKIIAKRFKLDPSVESFVGEKPRSLVYARQHEPILKDGEIQSGAKITESIGVHWDDHNTTVKFHAQDDEWVFNASKMIKGYFSISVSLSSNEIEMLDPNLLLSFGCTEVQKTSKKPITSNIFGKMTFVRGSHQNFYEVPAEKYFGRKLISFSLNDPGVIFSEMFRVWLDFIIAEPNTKTIIIREPLLVLQKRIAI